MRILKPDRFQTGAYVHNGRTLFRISLRDGDRVWLENALNGWEHDVPALELWSKPWKLAKAAPVEHLEQLLESD